ncbi:uncharacterized protein LAESUDRAFT_693249 [Laetiporus sulphureus 93-53]|uniref:Arrestin C-terminal-like domain-containing protein n=1 Tax=Laetiporus sulphureus 93-53 TaxID=1314785 RepID=A0A165GUU6_9APHY|nr:uncharacterized protein LAESUDRAFT_693249 [Laetiporus sulphureus 93-53]KZT10843.1 hypothetical protein LAESUDRAFT_693249 [Laetiporus sulphureus 93-53]
MSFILTRPPSPPADVHHHSDEDPLVAALNNAFQSFTGGASSNQHSRDAQHDADMHRDKIAPSLDIVVNSDTLVLRGTGVDVDPALLSGNVVLNLTEPTSLKEIVLQFRGKARLPVSASEPLSLSSSQLTYLVCNHEWSFLEGNRSHSHTLKAGRHLFPFQLQIGGSLPSSISTAALGGASVQYKLRATAVRPGFGLTHRDLAANLPINILRGFGGEALEYQQTLEIENTWPEKLMYSIMLPHKAWAAGERVIAVVKFSPLVKGARVLNVTTTINETVKLYARQGTQESTRVISSTRHDIVDGQAVCVDEQHHRYHIPLFHHSSHSQTTRPGSLGQSTPASPDTGASHAHHSHTASGTHTPAGNYFPPPPPTTSHPPSPLHHTSELTPLMTTTTNSSQSSGVGSGLSRPISAHGAATPLTALSPSSASDESLPSAPCAISPLPVMDPSEMELIEPAVDVVSTLSIAVPLHATPSHSLEPIQVSHRIRWSIMIGNRDGHTSELRCSLPLHILDHKLYDEARAATLHTRRILLGPQDIEGGQAVGTHGEDPEEDNDLPSYPAHVRDRVANAYISDAAALRVVNPWVMQGVSPTLPPPVSEGSSGLQSPAAFETWQVNGANAHAAGQGRHHLPQEPAPGATAPLEWVNTELLLSLSGEAPEAPVHPPPPRVTPPNRTPPESSPRASRHGSRYPSRANSRAASPERGPVVLSAGGGVHGPHGHGETYVHSHSTASRNMHSLFNIAMKPFTSLGSTFSLGSRSPSHTNLAHGNGNGTGHGHGHGHSHSHSHSAQHGVVQSVPQSHGSSTAPSASASSVNLASLAHSHSHPHPHPHPHPHAHPQTMTSPEQLHYAFTEVPDYDMASRGFLGGGITPLSSLRGLPSYEEARAEREVGGVERSFSDANLVGWFAAGQRGQLVQGQAQVSRTVASTPPTEAVSVAAAAAASQMRSTVSRSSLAFTTANGS